MEELELSTVWIQNCELMRGVVGWGLKEEAGNWVGIWKVMLIF